MKFRHLISKILILGSLAVGITTIQAAAEEPAASTCPQGTYWSGTVCAPVPDNRPPTPTQSPPSAGLNCPGNFVPNASGTACIAPTVGVGAPTSGTTITNPGTQVCPVGLVFDQGVNGCKLVIPTPSTFVCPGGWIPSTQAAFCIAPISAGSSEKVWSVPDDADRGLHIQWFMDSSPGESVSYLVDRSLWEDKFANPTCTSVNDPRCTSNSLTYSALLPFCVSESDLYCVEEFGIKKADGERVKAEFNRNFPSKILNPFEGDTKLGLPKGSSGALFSLPEAKHGGGDLYYLSVLTEGSVAKILLQFLISFPFDSFQSHSRVTLN